MAKVKQAFTIYIDEDSNAENRPPTRGKFFAGHAVPANRMHQFQSIPERQVLGTLQPNGGYNTETIKEHSTKVSVPSCYNAPAGCEKENKLQAKQEDNRRDYLRVPKPSHVVPHDGSCMETTQLLGDKSDVVDISSIEDEESRKAKPIEQSRPPLAVISTYPSSYSTQELSASPMLLDATVEEAPADKLSNAIPFMEYVNDVYAYLTTEVEKKFRSKASYMRKQPDITHNMRSILVDWLVEVAEEYRLHEETLHLAVSYIDRFLSCMSVLRSKLQLVGTASMFIAAKYEEIYPPEVGEFVYITDDTYTKKQVLRMEHLILKVLAFDLATATSNYFLRQFCVVVQCPEIVLHLAQYFCELSLLEGDPYLQFLPSIIAAASLLLANHTLGKQAWSTSLSSFSGYTAKDLSACVHCLHRTFVNAPSYPQQAVREKYKSPKFHHVALLEPPELLPC